MPSSIFEAVRPNYSSFLCFCIKSSECATGSFVGGKQEGVLYRGKAVETKVGSAES